MATTITPVAGTPSTDPRPTGDVRLARIRANLMPDEVIIARRTEALRRQIVLVLIVVAALLVAWYAVSWWQTHSSNDDLSAANHHTTALGQQQTQFAKLLQAQNDVATINTDLAKLMVGDLQWRDMLASLRSHAPSGISLTNVVGSITSGAAAQGGSGPGSAPSSGYNVFNLSGDQAVGSLTITGTAHDKQSIATYLDALNKVKGLAAATPTNVATATGRVTFTVSVIITSDALGGRYATQGGR